MGTNLLELSRFTIVLCCECGFNRIVYLLGMCTYFYIAPNKIKMALKLWACTTDGTAVVEVTLIEN